MRTVVTNGLVLDTATMSFRDQAAVVIEDGVIVDVPDRYAGTADAEVDARGCFVLPGLIDAHVHLRIASMNFRAMQSWTEVEYGIHMASLARRTVERGFTTVRDLGGDVTGLIRAIAGGACAGPRIVRAGRMLSQTGGHGDVEGGDLDVPACGCSMRSSAFGIVADGVDAVRKAARHNLRDGSDFLKVHASGGVASPTDPIEATQYTPDELRAAVTEAEHRGTYVAAHAYTPAAIQQSVANGVHTIEHGNLLDESTARLMVDAGAVLVPTLVTYYAMKERGAEFGLPTVNRDKNATILDAGLEALEIAHRLGVTMGLGTDLLGETQPMQPRELAIRREVEPAEAILRSMWITNAGLCRLEGRIGLIAPRRVRRCRRVAGRPVRRHRRVRRRRRLAQPRDPGRPGHRRTVNGFRSIIWFKVCPGAEATFEAAFNDAGMLTRPNQIDGFAGAELLRSTTARDEYYVIGIWSSPAAYAAWQAIANDGAPPEALARLIDSIVEHRPGQLFGTVNTIDPGRPSGDVT